MLPINELLQEGRYRITRHIGQSTAGFIYEGFDNVFEKRVIVNHSDGNSGKNLSGDGKFLKGIKHESFLRVTDFFAEMSNNFAVIEADEGEFLTDIFEKSGSIQTFSVVIKWAEQFLDGLGYLHLHLPPVIYGDIKPQNIFLNASGKVKFLTTPVLKNQLANKNFGKTSPDALNYLPLEQIWDKLDSASQNAIGGSFDEKAEKILRQPLDARCDIYSLGVLLYQLLTGQMPKNALERSIDILEGNPDPLISPDALNQDIPFEISDVIKKSLEIRREKRFDSAVMMRQILRTAFVHIRERQSVEAEKNAASKKPEIAEKEFLKDNHSENRSAQKQTVDAAAHNRFKQPDKITEKPDLTVSTNLEREESVFADVAKSLNGKNSENILELDEPDKEDILELEQIVTESEFSDSDKEAEKPEKATVIPLPEISVQISPEVFQTDYKKDYSTGEYNTLFKDAEENSRSKWKFPAIALILILIGGGSFGAWMFVLKNNPGETSQSEISAPLNTVTNPTAKNPPPENIETPTALSAENVVTTSNISTENAAPETDFGIETNTASNPVLTQETTQTAKKQTVIKPKNDISKTQTASAKTVGTPKKKVTVDDLITDY